MTNIELTPAELELIQAKRMEAEQEAAAAKAKVEAERAKKIAHAQTLLDRAVKIHNHEYDTMKHNWAAYKQKGTSTWKWTEKTVTLKENALLWNDETRNYEVIKELTAEVSEAKLTNGSLTIAYDSDKGYYSNIYIDRPSRWNPHPQPKMCGYGINSGYKSLRTAISKAEGLKEDLDRIERAKNTKQTLQSQAVTQLQAAYPTATITPDEVWDKYSNRSRPAVKVVLANGITIILEPLLKDEAGIVRCTRSSITFPAVNNEDLLSQLNAITIPPRD